MAAFDSITEIQMNGTLGFKKKNFYPFSYGLGLLLYMKSKTPILKKRIKQLKFEMSQYIWVDVVK